MQTLVDSPLEMALMKVFLQQKNKVKELRTESSGKPDSTSKTIAELDPREPIPDS